MKKALFILLALVLVFAISCEPEHEHKFEEKVVPATCTTEGKKYKVCSCGAKDDEVTIPPTGHSKDLTLEVGEAPTEEKAGHYNYVCPVCKEVVKTEDIEKLLPRTIFVPKNAAIVSGSEGETVVQVFSEALFSLRISPSETHVKADNLVFKDDAEIDDTKYSGTGSFEFHVVEKGVHNIIIDGTINQGEEPTTEFKFTELDFTIEYLEKEPWVKVTENGGSCSYKTSDSEIETIGIDQKVLNLCNVLQDDSVLDQMKQCNYVEDDVIKADGVADFTSSYVVIRNETEKNIWVSSGSITYDDKEHKFAWCRDENTEKILYLQIDGVFYNPEKLEAAMAAPEEAPEEAIPVGEV